jgi:hypothetical protein
MIVFFIISVIISPIVGIMLGFRFQVLALLPVTFLITTTIAANGLASSQEFRIVALTILCTAVSVQLGYISGVWLLRTAHHPMPIVVLKAKRISNI